MGKSLLILAVGLGVVFSQPASSQTWYVDGSVTASGDGLTWETAFETIQEGIDASSDGDTVFVAEGAYVENIRFNGKNITLTSTDPLDSTVVANTVIDGNQSGSVVTFSGTEDDTCSLSGFTIRNGRAVAGAGILGHEEPGWTHATIANNLITDNVALNGGGGLSGCDGTIRNNLITHNSGGIYGAGGLSFCDGNIVHNTVSFNSGRWGGGLSRCDGTVENNLIIGNEAEQYGGGVYDCSGVVQKNTIIENYAAWHGGGLSSCRRGIIRNNVIAGNAADGWGGGAYACGTVVNNTIVGNFADLGGGLASCSGTIKNCIVWGNNDNYGYELIWSVDPLYSCIEGWLGGGEGNIAQDPGLVDADGPDGNAETCGDNDYHLSASSPCIDAGVSDDAVTDDMDGEIRPEGAGTDMGADEYADTDEDALPDYWERKYFGDLGQDAPDDSDSDGLANAEELVLSTNPNKNDTDGDGFSDGDEVAGGTDPNSASSVPSEADVYVNGALGDDANDGVRPLTAKKTIQAGIDAAQDGDTVVVMEGIYLENIKFKGKNIILRSMNPSNPSCVARTIIDGNQAGSVVTFAGTENETCVLAGLTIRNGDADLGGGICGGRDSNYTHATVHNNVITANSAMMGGGVSGCAGEIRENTISANNGSGLYACAGIIENNVISANSGAHGGGLYSCSGIIRNNSITRNWASYGGALGSCNGLIEGNTISDNHASSSGGGLYSCRGAIRGNVVRGNTAWRDGGGLYMCGDVIQSNIIVDNHVSHYQSGGGGLASCSGVENNLIAGNSAPSGGGLYWCSGSIQNNTIVENTAFSGSGAAIYDREARSTIRNCIIWGNTPADGTQLYDAQTPSYSCIEGWAGGGDGNISDDPRFLDADGPDGDPYTFDDNDYRLSANSPCIDAGVNYLWFTWPQQDLDGNCRFVGSSVDMGCYEFGSSPDADGDLLSDAQEAALGTDPDLEDTDGDGLRDGAESLRGSDPLTATPAAILEVPSDFSTVQFALFLSGAGDEIVVLPGTYYENIILYGPDVILRSTGPTDPNIVASTVLDGRGLAPVVSFSGSETESCVLAGFTIRNGKRGIYGRSTRATIRHNVITSNTFIDGPWSQGGGGITGCSGAIRHNTIVGNTADHGAGLASCSGIIEKNLVTENSAVGNAYGSGAGGGLYYCGGTIRNNVISNNTATGSGGGLARCDAMIDGNIVAANSAANDGGGLNDCGSNTINVPPGPPEPPAIIRSNLIVGNSAKRGGGVSNSIATIQNNTVVGNTAEEGGGLHDSQAITNCVVWGNTAVQGAGLYNSPFPTYSCIQDWFGWDEGNIAEDPQFVDPSGPDGNPQTWEDNDYRLSPDSPCIDTGANPDWMWEAVDPDGNPRIWNATVDMGAYEYGSFHFKVTQVTESAGRHLTWSSRPGDAYTIWSCGDLAVGDWTEEATVASEGETTTWTDANATQSRQKFYRIQIHQ